MRTTTLCGLALMLLAAGQNTAWGQTTYTWSGTGTQSAWLDPSYWTGTPAGRYPGTSSASNGNMAGDIALFSGSGTTSNVGINMNSAGGSLSLGAIDMNRTVSTALKIGNSSTSTNGILQLNGATLHGVANTLIAVRGSGNLTITNDNAGTGTQTMGLRLGIEGGKFQVATLRTLTIDSVISQANPGSGFSLLGGGTLVLNAANTFSGSVSVDSGTVVLATGNNRLPTGTMMNLGSGSSNGVLQLGTGTVAVTQQLAGLTTSGSGTANAVVGGASSNSTLHLNIQSGTHTFSGTIGGTGTNQNRIALAKSGAGTLVLTGTNTYSGGTVINGGILQFNSAAAIGGSAENITVNAGGTMAANFAAANSGLARVVGSSTGVFALGTDSTAGLDFSSKKSLSLGAVGSVTYSGDLDVDGIYRLGGGGGTLTVNTSLSGSNAVRIDTNGTAAGTVILAGNNTYTDQTRVYAGTLAVNGSLSSSSAVTVVGGTLGGKGTIGGTVTVNPGGTIRGDSETGTGTLSLGNATKIVGAADGGGATLATYLDVEDGSIVANSKLTTGTNALNFDLATTGKFNILLLNDAGLTAGQSYTITLANGSNFRRNDVGATSFSASDFTLASGSGSWEFLSTSLSVSSSKLELTFVPTTPVPEPATTLALGAIGLYAAVGVRRCMPRGAEVAEVRVVPDGRAVPAGGFLSPTAASCRTHAIVVS